MQKQNPSVQVAAWWCLVVAAIAACGVALGDFPLTTSSVLLLVMIILVPAAIMLALWRGAPTMTVADVLYAHDRTRAGDNKQRE